VTRRFRARRCPGSRHYVWARCLSLACGLRIVPTRSPGTAECPSHCLAVTALADGLCLSCVPHDVVLPVQVPPPPLSTQSRWWVEKCCSDTGRGPRCDEPRLLLACAGVLVEALTAARGSRVSGAWLETLIGPQPALVSLLWRGAA